MKSQKAVGGGKRARVELPRRKRVKRPRCPSTGKVRYGSQQSAVSALAVIAGRPKVAGGKVPIRSYKCPRCGGWHLTSTPKAGP